MHELLQLARSAIEFELSNQKLTIPVSFKSSYNHDFGVYVILKEKGVERGAFGFPETSLPLWKSLPQAAKAAAFNDPQFPPVTEMELRNLQIEIYLLSKPIQFIGLGFELDDAIMIVSYQGEAILLPNLAKTKEEVLELLHEKLNITDLNSNYYKFKTEIIK
ncbi:AMMECR1 domain-containing protein [Candidatus Woesearchaeota archaeon]|nr:AMMECR1 domain-containing protein [Candidatus Woesearchaeota archaeon]